MKNIRFDIVAEVDGMLFTLTRTANSGDKPWEYQTYPTRIMARIARQRLGDPYGRGEGKIMIAKRGTKK